MIMRSKSLFILVLLFLAISAAVLYYFLNSGALNEPVKPPQVISVLIASDLQLSGLDGLKAGLQELGYKLDKYIIIKLNNPKGDRNLTAQMAKDIVASKPDLIVTFSTTAASNINDANKESKIPVVFVDVGNFKQLGITDIRKPGGFMTGVVVDNVPAAPKRMELLKILNPNMKTIGVLVNNKHVSYDEILSAYEEGADKLGIKIIWYNVTTKEAVVEAMTKLIKDAPDAYMTTSEATISGNAALIAPLLKKARIPSIDFNVEVGVQSGYLMVHGVNRFDTGKQSSRIVAKVLRGENPGDIPIEFSSTLTFEINEVLAKEMNIVIPEELLLRANKVYKQ